MVGQADLAGLLVRRAATAGSGYGAAQPVAFRKGVVAFWNATTGENNITIDGQSFGNLPILNRSEIPNILVGDVVAVLVIGSGSTTMAIVGGIVDPAP